MPCPAKGRPTPGSCSSARGRASTKTSRAGPFVGASGQYLEELLAGIGLTPQDVFIANVIKCRPPGNRDPEPASWPPAGTTSIGKSRCIQPAVVVTLGRFSMERYFPGQSITRIHGQPKRVGDVYYLPMFHPAAALRNPEWRQEMVNDFAAHPAAAGRAGRAKAPKQRDPAQDEADEHYTQLSLF